VRAFHPSPAPLLLLSVVYALAAAACRTTGAPAPQAPQPPPEPGPAPAAGAGAAVGPVPESPPVPPGPPPSQARLPFVSPSRCLSPCGYDPADTLVRIDEQGAPAPVGKHRVVAEVQAPLQALVAAARAAGHLVRVQSAYRSYRDQARVFATTKEIGRAARPGHSEHQLGTAVDLRLPTTAAIEWLAENAASFGFALSYPPGKQKLTGYRPEPWHVRFVGVALAAQMREHRWSIAELFRARPELAESGACDDCPAAVSRAPCGAATAAGSCAGTVLTWCYEGALATVDCATSQQVCGPVPGVSAEDPPGPVSAPAQVSATGQVPVQGQGQGQGPGQGPVQGPVQGTVQGTVYDCL
jgi:zinc D-Ala-D-Ala carboxypeptidase